MTTTNLSSEKKTLPSAKPSPNGDHRKRPRNRTTQSCLNCHTSKRMCDRRRPACSRCVQLGLTGVCVYEVDDPKQRAATDDDESSRLLKRVAELEGVVRELKHKPHPRWLHSPKLREGDKELSTTNPAEPSSPYGRSEQDSSSCSGEKESGQRIPDLLQTELPIYSRSHSGSTTPSSALLTPSDERANPFSTMVTPDKGPPVQACDMASIPFEVIESTFGPIGLAGQNKPPLRPHGSHCGCLHDPTNYHVMLELSLGLRRAANVLRQSPSHQLGGFCPLHQGVSQLDSLTMDTLSSSTSSQRLSSASVTRAPYPNVRTWDVFSLYPNSSHVLDDSDSFMTWEPSRT